MDSKMNKNKSYQSKGYKGPSSGKIMGHEKAPSKLDAMPMNSYDKKKCPNRGYDSKAYDYNY